MTDRLRIYASSTPPAKPLNRPWECPRCGRINAWWVASCRCAPKNKPQGPYPGHYS